jgi:hypothetical protein
VAAKFDRGSEKPYTDVNTRSGPIGRENGTLVLFRQVVHDERKDMMRRRSMLIAGVSMLIIGACVPAVSSETPTSRPTPTISCETHAASVVLAASAESLKVGDTVIVTATLNNRGCAALGLPQYRLYIQSDGPESVLAPDNPEPMTHYLEVAPEHSDTAEFDLQAVADGEAILTASVSFEVHLGYPEPAYWGSSSGEPLLITVAP